ncbi:cysteine hydrolase family protein [Paenibacillus montanisoli]|uniref:Protein-signal peptide and transmembrane prediction n=1 Tax=Paenibacillus montanisoli TaxID=2081970 RepID=A0A328U7U1_9BACL|nr:cysteine hydrolase family protein [Paenibacillus montanisoli]RAP78540.1 protein-signal peptide and transmembrane prediction [Paenibacillus montanisoli]
MKEFILKTRRLSNGDGRNEVIEETVSLDAAKTAVIVCDMWDKHWCVRSTARAAEMAPRMNELIDELRSKGALIIHAPSETMAFYSHYPGRELARSVMVEGKSLPNDWKNLNPALESPLPIDDSDGGCDCSPPCVERRAWTRQIELIDILDSDAITDTTEAIHLMLARGIVNVFFMGVATNMCVLGRPFGIRNLVQQGFNTILVRDMTDSMYNPAMPPYVDHFTGTELVIRHIERYWCPTVTSDQFLGGSPFRFRETVEGFVERE